MNSRPSLGNLVIIENRSIIRGGIARVLTEDLRYGFSVNGWDSPDQFLVEEARDFTGIILFSGDPFNKHEILNFTERMKKTIPAGKIVVYYSRIHFGAWDLKTFIAHIDGYIADVLDTDELNRCTANVLRGRKFVSGKIACELFQNIEIRPEAIKLSRRESMVAKYLITGFKPKDIAKEIGITISTVSNLKTKIYKKIKVTNIIDLAEKLESGHYYQGAAG